MDIIWWHHIYATSLLFFLLHFCMTMLFILLSFFPPSEKNFLDVFLPCRNCWKNSYFFVCVPFESLTHLLYCSVRNEKKIYGLLKLWVRYNLFLLNLILNEIFFILSIVCSWINVIFIHFPSHKWHLRFIIGNNGGILEIFWGTQCMYLSYDEQKNFKLNSAHMCV